MSTPEDLARKGWPVVDIGAASAQRHPAPDLTVEPDWTEPYPDAAEALDGMLAKALRCAYQLTDGTPEQAEELVRNRLAAVHTAETPTGCRALVAWHIARWHRIHFRGFLGELRAAVGEDLPELVELARPDAEAAATALAWAQAVPEHGDRAAWADLRRRGADALADALGDATKASGPESGDVTAEEVECPKCPSYNTERFIRGTGDRDLWRCLDCGHTFGRPSTDDGEG